jgi:cell fate regulator YaaT (PSP1 superfamily)
MSDYRDNHDSRSDEELRRLEDEREQGRDEAERPRARSAVDPKELPSPLYRIRAIHSNETFFAFFPENLAPPNLPQPTATGFFLAGEPAEPFVGQAPSTSVCEAEGAAAEPMAAPEETAPLPETDEAAAPAPRAGETLAPESGTPAPETPGSGDMGDVAQRAVEPDVAEPSGSPRERVMVVAPTRYGRDLCELQGLVKDPGPVGRDDLVRIERIATAEDLRKSDANRERERKAFELCRQKISSRNLPMKLVSAHYLLEEPKVLFYFSAEARVDFRELVKDLVSVFKMRIELRQIGVRDEARVTGGCGVCGRVLCCHGVTDKLVPVSIKMAKDQNLSLNSMKISGPCGRLLCCLAYEYGFYRDARRELPNEGARFQYDGTLFRVVEVNPLAGKVKMAGEDGRVLDMSAARFAYSEGKWQVREEEE